MKGQCEIVSVVKRRDGGTRYWCLKHKADATAKCGLPGTKCRHADLPDIKDEDIACIHLENYPGGVGLWGAVPPIFDTTRLPLDRGIHVHARKKAFEEKDVDNTFRQVIVKQGSYDYTVSELDAIYFMVSSVFGFAVKEIHCTKCGYSHLDKDWFSVHPHQSHLCAGCGRNFRDRDIAVGNPVAALQDRPFAKKPSVRKSRKKLNIEQKNYPGGIQLWGSNPSILWTSDTSQETGIHVHAYTESDQPVIDDTFKEVVIDGIKLDEEQVRTYMAQCALTQLKGRVQPMTCNACGNMNFDVGISAFSPRVDHSCNACGGTIKANSRLRKVVANPISITLFEIAKFSLRPPQLHDLGLLSEMI